MFLSYNSNSTHTFPIQNWLKTFNFRSSCVFFWGVASQDFMGAFPEKNTTPLHLWPNQNKASIVLPPKKNPQNLSFPRLQTLFSDLPKCVFLGNKKRQQPTSSHDIFQPPARSLVPNWWSLWTWPSPWQESWGSQLGERKILPFLWGVGVFYGGKKNSHGNVTNNQSKKIWKNPRRMLINMIS